MLTKQIYKQWLYTDRLKEFEKEHNFSEQTLGKINGNLRCRYCKEVVDEKDFDKTSTYWWPYVWYVCHKACKVEGERDEAYECQKVDADCNDCKYFNREEVSLNGDVWTGVCSKTGKKVKGCPNTSTGHDCFEHRKDNLL